MRTTEEAKTTKVYVPRGQIMVRHDVSGHMVPLQEGVNEIDAGLAEHPFVKAGSFASDKVAEPMEAVEAAQQKVAEAQDALAAARMALAEKMREALAEKVAEQQTPDWNSLAVRLEEASKAAAQTAHVPSAESAAESKPLPPSRPATAAGVTGATGAQQSGREHR